MGNMIGNVQDRFKTTSSVVALIAFKIFTGLFLGLTLALIGDQIIGYGVFSLILVMLVTAGAVIKISKSWTWTHMFIFNLICLLVGMLLRMYILIAPG